jgi:hypothetical protein
MSRYLLSAVRPVFRARTFTPTCVRCLSTSSTATTTTRPEPQVADTLTQIGTRAIFDHECDMFRESVRKFYQDNVVPFTGRTSERPPR